MTSIPQTPLSEATAASSPSLLDPQTWEALYPRQFRKMVGYVVRQLGCDEMTAEDVVQDAVIRMWEHREDYPTPEHVPSLFTAFVRSQIRYHRSVQRKRQQEFAMTLVSLEQSADVAQVAAVDGSAEAVRTPEMQRALETFAGLPDAQQDLLRLVVQGQRTSTVWQLLQDQGATTLQLGTTMQIPRKLLQQLRHQAQGWICPECQQHGKYEHLRGMCKACYQRQRYYHRREQGTSLITCWRCQREGRAPHARGLCRPCYATLQKQGAFAEKVVKPAFVCAECGSAGKRHAAKGLCDACYHRQRVQRKAQEGS